MTLGYGAGKRDSLIFSPTLNYNLSHQQTANAFNFQDTNGVMTSSGTQAYSADNTSPNLSGSLTWLHRFARTGRTLSAWVNAGPGPVRETDNNFSTNHIYTPSSIDTIWQVIDMHTRKQQYSGSLNYTEPLGDGRNLELSYNYARNGNTADNNVYDVSAASEVLNDSLTNSFNNAMTTHNAGGELPTAFEKTQLSTGAGVAAHVP